MPGGDGTGPNGQGSMTGRGAGYCAGFDRPGFANPGFGRRGFGRGFRGRGFGRGFGFRRMAVAPVAPVIPVYREPVELSKEEKIKILEADRKDIEAELEEIKKEIDEIKKQK
ncbi:DUF5320 domain-containing protein [Candidatus Woesearchaeota archaeon]|nr:DUF5320 domain-containing protein [Candidatus Woesearchaeota archaeon]